MIVCSCNVLSEARIKAALAGPNPPRRALVVHHRLGCKPQCGCCARAIIGLIRESQGCQRTEPGLEEECIKEEQAA